MKKFFSTLGLASAAIFGLTNCSGGGDSNSDTDGDGAINAQEFFDGAGFEVYGNPIFRINRGRSYGDTQIGVNGNYAKCWKKLDLLRTSNNWNNVVDALVEYTYNPDARTGQIKISLTGNDLENGMLSTLLGQAEPMNFTGGEIYIDLDFNGDAISAAMEITATPINQDDNNEEVQQPETPDPNNPDAGNNNGNGGKKYSTTASIL